MKFDSSAVLGDPETLVWKIRWLLRNQGKLMVDIKPGPAFQFYPDRWISDMKVHLMDPAARGAHIHCMCFAWLESVPCSIPDDADHVVHRLAWAGIGWASSMSITGMSSSIRYRRWHAGQSSALCSGT